MSILKLNTLGVMKTCRMHDFGNFKGYELSHSKSNFFNMSVYLYLLDDLMVDTGQPNMQDAVLDIFSNHGLRQIALTHYHEDHAGNAFSLKRRLGTKVMGNGNNFQHHAKY